MSVKSAQAVTVVFTTANPTTGAAADADSTPAGTLYVNGTANGATVTVTNITTGVYKAALTLPSLTAGDVVSLRIAATVSSVAGEGLVWQDTTTAILADEVWDEATSGHATAGTFGSTVSGTATLVTAISSALTTLTNRVGAWTGTGVNTVLGAFKAALSKSATVPSDIGGTFDPAADSTEAISEAIAVTPTAQEVWEYVTRTLTQSSTSTTDSTAAGSISRRRGDSWSISLTVGALTGYTSLWFTVKADRDVADSAAIFQIKLNSPSASDGLLYVNGTDATDGTKGSITVSNASTGAIVIALDESITDDLPTGAWYYDVQALISGAVSTPDSGTFTVTADVTRSIT